MYRILYDLEWGNGRKLLAGSIDRLKGVSSGVRARLESTGAISRVAAPPLEILPGWENLAPKLEAVGVKDVVDLLEADPGRLAEELDTTTEEIESYVVDARRFITIEEEDGCGCS